MTRAQAIERWKDIASTVFWAENHIIGDWHDRLRASKTMSAKDKSRVWESYLDAIATEILSKTTDEELLSVP